MARGARAITQPSSHGLQHAPLAKLGQQVEALTKGFSQRAGNAAAAQRQLQLARTVCEAVSLSVTAVADSAEVRSKMVALAERLGSFCWPLSTGPSTFGQLVNTGPVTLTLIDAACYAAAAYYAVLHARACQRQRPAEVAAAARTACAALDAGAAALRHTVHSAAHLLGRGPNLLDQKVRQLAERLHMQVQTASILRPLAYPALEPSEEDEAGATPATYQQGRWVLSYSLAAGMLYAWTPGSRDAPDYAPVSFLVQYCNLLLGVLEDPSLRRQRDELLGHPASLQAVVTVLADVCMPALTMGLEAHSGGQLGTATQRQQEGATMRLLQLCALLPGMLAAPQLQPALASQPAELQQRLHSNVHKLAAGALLALPAKPSDAMLAWHWQLAWQGAAELPCLMLRQLQQQGATAGSAEGSSGRSDRDSMLHLHGNLCSAAAEAAGHLPAACDALAVMAHGPAPDSAALEEAVGRCSTAVRLLIHVSTAAPSLQDGLFGGKDSAAQPVAACVAAAAAVLRYLPFLSELRRMWPQLPTLKRKPRQTPERLAQSLLGLWHAWAVAAYRWEIEIQRGGQNSQQAAAAAQAAGGRAAAPAAAEGALGSQSDAAATATATAAELQARLEHLHTIGCRVVHFLATPSGQQLFAGLDEPRAGNHWLPVAVSALNCTLAAAGRGLNRQRVAAADKGGAMHSVDHLASSVRRSLQDAAQQAGRHAPPLALHRCSEMDLVLAYIAGNCQQYTVEMAESPITALLVEDYAQSTASETSRGLARLAKLACASPQLAAVMSRRGVFARLLSSEQEALVASLTCIPRAAGLLEDAAVAALEQLRRSAGAGSGKQAAGASSRYCAAGSDSSAKEHQAVKQQLNQALADLLETQDEQPPGGRNQVDELRSLLRTVDGAAGAMLSYWALPEQAAAARLEAARAAAGRRCANLRCANLQGGLQRKKCLQCGTRYCSAACCIADWREGGHKGVCAALAARWQQAEE